MKRLLIIPLLFTCCSLISQTKNYHEEAKKFEQILQNRPRSWQFTEQDAWDVLTGRKYTSDKYFINDPNFRSYHLMIQKHRGYVWFARSDDNIWWYTYDNVETGEWKPNWILIIAIFVSIFLFYSLNRKLNERFITKRNKFITRLSKSENDKNQVSKMANTKAGNEMMVSIALFSILPMMIVPTLVTKFNDNVLYVPCFIFWLSLIVPYLRINSKIKKGNKFSESALI